MPAQSVSKETFAVTPRILIIDHHDSYTLNLLISLSQANSHSSSSSKELLSRTVILPHNHELLSSPELFKKSLLPHFDALILGPGPGHPGNERDFGPAGRILQSILDGDIVIPVLGICLGHQGLAVACGGKVVQADSLRHGQSSKVEISANAKKQTHWPSLFEKLQERTTNGESSTTMIRYNSLTVDEASLPSSLIVTAWSQESRSPAPAPRCNRYYSTLDVRSSAQAPSSSTSLLSSQRVVMALQHRSLPLWSVQFHFESVSSDGGSLILEQFLLNCRIFWQNSSSSRVIHQSEHQRYQHIDCPAPLNQLPAWVRSLGQPLVACSAPNRLRAPQRRKHLKVVSKKVEGSVPIGYENADRIFDELFRSQLDEECPAIWLDSAREGDAQNRYSYMGRPSWRLAYKQVEKSVELHGMKASCKAPLASFNLKPSHKSVVEVHGLSTPKPSRPNSPDDEAKEMNSDMWSWLSDVQESFQSCTEIGNNSTMSPFKTGFVGCFDYEMRKESLLRGKDSFRRRRAATQQSKVHSGLPSAWFGFCDKILVYDHRLQEWATLYLQKIDDSRLPGIAAAKLESALNLHQISVGVTDSEGQEWESGIQKKLLALNGRLDHRAAHSSRLPPLTNNDSAAEYKDKIEAARAYIGAGESYELCLTTQFTGRLESDLTSSGFDLYAHLRRKNPAPFSAYLNLGLGQSILSTSPERFMSIEADGRVEMRPIKGTLARAGYKVGEEEIRTAKERGDASSILWCEEEDERRRNALHCDAKEVAENLMIVDLIRADLLSFCPPDTVTVPSLMKVESYESVHQLVTTITGCKDEGVSSVQALKRCFPPGSMTGAPKVRSVDLLDQLEERERGMYSGILGWIGVDGAANTSVVIRTVIVNGRDVSVGAGGAITYLSDAEKEWEEMLDKVKAIANVVGEGK